MKKKEQGKQESKTLYEVVDSITEEEEGKYRNLIDSWRKSDRRYWLNKISTAPYPNQQAKDIDILIKTVNENFILDRNDHLAALAYICFLALKIDQQHGQLNALTKELRAVGLLKKKLEETSQAVKKRERLFERIDELYRPRHEKKQKTSKNHMIRYIR